MPLKLQSSSGGSVTLDVPVTSSNYNVTVPNATGTAMVSGNMPAFSAYISGYQGSVSQSTWTKASLNSEYYDTNSNFNTSTYRFTPTVAGYYQVSAVISLGSAGGSYPTGGYVQIWKNGSGAWGNQIASPSNQILGPSCSGLIYMNGSTDYLELYGYMTGGSSGAYNGDGGTIMQGVLVRAA